MTPKDVIQQLTNSPVKQKSKTTAEAKAWLAAIQADLEGKPFTQADKQISEKIANNVDRNQHTLAFLEVHPCFDINQVLKGYSYTALELALGSNNSINLIKLLLNHHADPNIYFPKMPAFHRMYSNLCAFSYDTGESDYRFHMDSLKAEMKVGREKLELYLCYDFKPTLNDIRAAHFQPKLSHDENHALDQSLNGSEMKKALEELSNTSNEEQFYNPDQCIPEEELTVRLKLAMFDIKTRKEKLSKPLKADMGTFFDSLTTDLVFQYSGFRTQFSEMVYQQRQAEKQAICFNYAKQNQ